MKSIVARKKGGSKDTPNVSKRPAPIVRSLNPGFPQRLGTTLRYTVTSVAAITGVNSTTLWGFNTPSQPGWTVDTTSKPQYYTTLSTVYDQCYTVRCRAKARVQNLTVPDGVLVIVSHDNNGTVSSSGTALREKPYAQTGLLGHYQGGTTSFTGAIEFVPERFLGIPADDVRNTEISAFPSDTYTFVVGVQSIAGGEGNLAVTVEMEYDLVWSQIRDP